LLAALRCKACWPHGDVAYTGESGVPNPTVSCWPGTRRKAWPRYSLYRLGVRCGCPSVLCTPRRWRKRRNLLVSRPSFIWQIHCSLRNCAPGCGACPVRRLGFDRYLGGGAVGVIDGGAHCLGPVFRVEITQDRADMRLYRFFRDKQCFGNFPVGLSVHQETQYLFLFFG